MRQQPSHPAADLGEPVPRPSTGRLPGWVALPAAAGLIALVALASRSTSVAPGAITLDFSPAMTTIEVIGYVGIGVGLCALLLGAAVWRGRMRRLRLDRLRASEKRLAPVPWWMNVIGVAVMLGMLVFEAIIVIAYIAELRRLAEKGASGGGVGDIPGVDTPFGAPPQDLAALSIALVIVLGLGVVLIAFALRTRLHDDRSDDAPAGDPGATVAAVDLSLAALRSEPDARRAVIAAYGAMERSLSGAGFGRRRSEAPLEYLRRVLAAPTRAAEEVRTITLLFQHAKFSSHAVDETMRHGAIDALERIRHAAGGTMAAGGPA